MDAFYIAGADHYRRTTASGEPDTIAKLERVEEQEEAGSRLQTVSAIFLHREGMKGEQGKVTTSLNVHVLPPIPFSFSSSAVRHALCKQAFSEALGSLPYSVLLEIRAGGLYLEKGECVENVESPA